MEHGNRATVHCRRR